MSTDTTRLIAIDLDFALAAAGGSVDQQVQAELWHVLDRHRTRCRPRHSDDAIAAMLGAALGTPLEPFTLSERSAHLAIWLIGLAFSTGGRQTRLRILSDDTIGGGGGLVVTSNLRCYFVERYVRGKHREVPHVGWVLKPSAAPRMPADGAVREAEVRIEEHSVRVTVPAVPGMRYASVELESPLQPHSIEIHTRLTVSGNAVSVEISGAEQLLRLTALLEGGLVVRFQGALRGRGPAADALWLDQSRLDAESTVAALTYPANAFFRFLHARHSHRIELPAALAHRVVRTFGAAWEWTTPATARDLL